MPRRRSRRKPLPGSYTKAGPVTIRRPGEEPEEQLAYSSGQHMRIVAAGRRGEREQLQSATLGPSNAQVRRGDVHRVSGAKREAASGETGRGG